MHKSTKLVFPKTKKKRNFNILKEKSSKENGFRVWKVETGGK